MALKKFRRNFRSQMASLATDRKNDFTTWIMDPIEIFTPIQCWTCANLYEGLGVKGPCIGCISEEGKLANYMKKEKSNTDSWWRKVHF